MFKISLLLPLYILFVYDCCFVFKGERDAPLYFVDSSKAVTPVSRYGGYYSIHQPQNYSGSITPLSCHSHQFELIHLESVKEKLNRLSRDKGSFFSRLMCLEFKHEL
jgi:hypothetical protein